MDVSPAQRWTLALSSLQSKLSTEQLEQWFRPLRCVKASASQIVLEAPNGFHRDWVRDHYSRLLDDAFGAAVSVEAPTFPRVVAAVPSGPRPATETPDGALNLKYTFDRFVVGSGNRFAHAASLAVADSPAKAYNPLFIYGGVGLGKTHLMQAIGHALLARSAAVRVVYISSEQFTNQLITAIQHRTTPKFREKYRYVDVLLIDDVHFIAGKESTQEEFFHTFNALHDAHKQIVLSSDRSPKDIDGLEARLVSRFEWGLVTDIQPPDLETRIAILRKKTEDVGVMVPDDVTTFIGERVKSNIRELEGAMIRVVAFAQFTGRDLSLALAQEVLRDMMAEEAQRITVASIQRAVATFFGLETGELCGKKRSKTISQPRQLAMFLARELTDHSLPELGRFFGGRDHTTVLHAVNKVQRELGTNAHQRVVVEKLRHLIRR